MKKEYLDKIQIVLDELESSTYKRVDEDILWVGASDEELNRTIDLSFHNSLRIQIGTAMNYFEGIEANEKKVLSLFVRAMFEEITETRYCKGGKVLKIEYQLIGSDGIENLGLNSSLNSLIKKGDNRVVIKHSPVLNLEQYTELNNELKKVYNTM